MLLDDDCRDVTSAGQFNSPISVLVGFNFDITSRIKKIWIKCISYLGSSAFVYYSFSMSQVMHIQDTFMKHNI